MEHLKSVEENMDYSINSVGSMGSHLGKKKLIPISKNMMRAQSCPTLSNP